MSDSPEREGSARVRTRPEPSPNMLAARDETIPGFETGAWSGSRPTLTVRRCAAHEGGRGSPDFVGVSAFRVETHGRGRGVLEEVGRLGEAVATLMVERDDGSLQLRFWARDGKLSVYLLAGSNGTTRAICSRRVGQLVDEFGLCVEILRPTYTFVPVEDKRRLRQLLALGDQGWDLVEIASPVTSHQPSGLRLPALTVPVVSNLHSVCLAMAAESRRLRTDLALFATLEPAPDAGALVVQARQQLGVSVEAEPFRPGGLSVVVARDPLGPGNGDLGARHGLMVRAQTFVGIARGSVPRSVTSALLMEGTMLADLASSGPSFSALPVAKPRELAQVRVALRELRVTDWELAHLTDRPALNARRDDAALASGLRNLRDLRQALTLFKLPVPGVQPWPRPLEAPSSMTNNDGLVIGQSLDGAEQLAMSWPDLAHHLWICGKTGTGKSTVLRGLICQAIDQGMGVLVLDPHGDLSRDVLERVSARRSKDVIYLNVPDADFPVAFNFIESNPELRHMVVEDFIGALYEIFDPHKLGIVGPRFEVAVRNAMLMAMDMPEPATLIEVARILGDREFAREQIEYITDPMVRTYWTRQIPATSDFHASEVLDYVTSKFSRFVHNILIRHIIGQRLSSFSIREVMDEGKILIVNLAQGLVGRETSSFLGMMLMNQVVRSALSRVDLPVEDRRPFLLVVDECQNFATPSFRAVLSELRKFGVCACLANQFVAQLPIELREAIVGNVGSTLAFRTGLADAQFAASLMAPSALSPADFLALPNFTGIGSFLRDGERYGPVGLTTLVETTSTVADPDRARAVIRSSRLKYGRSRESVAKEINSRFDET